MVAGPALRIAFFGTPDFAVATLDALLRSRHQVAAVVTQPDRPRGRGQRVTVAPVKQRAIDARLPILQRAPSKLAVWKQKHVAVSKALLSQQAPPLTRTILPPLFRYWCRVPIASGPPSSPRHADIEG